MIENISVDKILEHAKRNRIKALSNELDNVVFLDIDGVINTPNNYTQDFDNKNAINNLNKLCIQNNLKIVLISSWRKYPNINSILYNSGLNNNIEIIGKTIISDKGREYEIKNYLYNNYYINKFIILDDGLFNELKKYQIRTNYYEGFNNEKYAESLELINKI